MGAPARRLDGQRRQARRAIKQKLGAGAACAFAHSGRNLFAASFVSTASCNGSGQRRRQMLVAIMALSMSLALMVSALVILHNEGHNQLNSRKKAVFQNH
jgi:hypothetical protein